MHSHTHSYLKCVVHTVVAIVIVGRITYSCVAWLIYTWHDSFVRGMRRTHSRRHHSSESCQVFMCDMPPDSHTRAHTNTRTHAHTHTHTHWHTRTNTHSGTHAHTHTCRDSFLSVISRAQSFPSCLGKMIVRHEISRFNCNIRYWQSSSSCTKNIFAFTVESYTCRHHFRCVCACGCCRCIQWPVVTMMLWYMCTNLCAILLMFIRAQA